MKSALSYRILAIAGSTILTIGSAAQAQLSLVAGSTDGSYCKFKKNNIIEVDTWLPVEASAAFGHSMTLRRGAEMAISKGFASFITLKEGCGTLVRSSTRNPVGLRCGLKAKLETGVEAAAPIPEGQVRYSAPEIIAQTQADAPKYPRRTGLLNYKNQCVIT